MLGDSWWRRGEGGRGWVRRTAGCLGGGGGGRRLTDIAEPTNLHPQKHRVIFCGSVSHSRETTHGNISLSSKNYP
jgi:hypothetical protein